MLIVFKVKMISMITELKINYVAIKIKNNKKK